MIKASKVEANSSYYAGLYEGIGEAMEALQIRIDDLSDEEA